MKVKPRKRNQHLQDITSVTSTCWLWSLRQTTSSVHRCAGWLASTKGYRTHDVRGFNNLTIDHRCAASKILNETKMQPTNSRPTYINKELSKATHVYTATVLDNQSLWNTHAYGMYLMRIPKIAVRKSMPIVVQFDTDQNTPNKNIVTFPKCSASHKARNSTHNKRRNACGLDYCQHHIAQITSIDDMNFRWFGVYILCCDRGKSVVRSSYIKTTRVYVFGVYETNALLFSRTSRRLDDCDVFGCRIWLSQC